MDLQTALLKAGVAPALKDAVTSDSDLIDFFKSGTFGQSPAQFQKHWKSLSYATLSAAEIVRAFRNTAYVLSQSKDQPAVRACMAVVRENLSCWQDRFILLKEDMTPNKISDALWGFAKLDIVPDIAFLSAWEDEALKKIDDFDAQNVANCLWSFATLGIVPGQKLLDALQERARVEVNRAAPHHLANILWSVAVLDVVGAKNMKEFARDIHAAIAGHPGKADLRFIHAGQIHQSCLWFDFPCDMLPPAESNNKSSFEEDLRFLFVKAGLRPVTDHVVPSIDHRVDITLPGDVPCLIELDGTQHFNRAAEGGSALLFNGPTLFQSALIRKYAGPSVLLRLPYDVAREIFKGSLDTQANKASWIAGLAHKKEPGAYRVNVNDSMNGQFWLDRI